nr:MAG TPA_asm: hypothetical protein [Caudoviricetes sp.]
MLIYCDTICWHPRNSQNLSGRKVERHSIVFLAGDGVHAAAHPPRCSPY